MKNGSAQKVREEILRLIEESKTKGNGRLPPERTLAEMTGVSRVTVGKIISQLSGEGVLVRRQGCGTFVIGAERSTRQLSIGIGAQGFTQQDTHFSKLLEGLGACAEKHSVSLQLFDKVPEHFARPSSDNRVMLAIENKLIDGFIFISRMPIGVIAQIKEKLPVVIVNGMLNDGELTCVSCDYIEVGHIAAKHLISCGHKRIAYCFDTPNHPEIWQNECGIRLAMESAGLQFRAEDRISTGRNHDYMKKYVGEFISANPDLTAIIVRNDLYAWKILNILEELGKKVPRDISVVSVGNYKEAGKSIFGLTTVDNQLETMAAYSLDLLVEMIKGNPPKEKIHLLRPVLVERDSVRDMKGD